MSGDTGPLGVAQARYIAQLQAENDELRERLHQVSDVAQSARLILEMAYRGQLAIDSPLVLRVIGMGDDSPIISGAEARKERG